MKIVFFLCLSLIVYVYIGYPLVIACVSRSRKRQVPCGSHLPSVSVVIAAYNEAACIEKTIKNKLSSDYPADKYEIIVVSDGSTDDTDRIVKQCENSGRVRLIRQEPRAGKTSALNLAVSRANGEIIVISDANSFYAPDTIRNLVRNFCDSSVGYVTGKMVYVDEKGSVIGSGCSAYMRYENFLREQETAAGSIVGVDGGVDAVRKVLYRPMRNDQLPDFVQPLRIIEQGYRVVYEPDAILKEESLTSADDEYRMRVRVSLRALWALFDMRHLLGFGHNLLFAWQLWSHKVMRYLCFVFMIGTLVANIFLLEEGKLYELFFAGQLAAYLAAVVSPFMEKAGFKSFYLFNYFALLNGAAMDATAKFVMREKQVTWTPRKG